VVRKIDQLERSASGGSSRRLWYDNAIGPNIANALDGGPEVWWSREARGSNAESRTQI